MEKLQKILGVTIIASETTHIFCCALPVLVSTFSLLSVLGLVAVAPQPILYLHDVIHDYEIPLIIFSGVILALGWGLFMLSLKLDCRSQGCEHEPCTPQKKRTSTILKVATVLFVFNVTIYALVHVPMDQAREGHHADHPTHTQSKTD